MGNETMPLAQINSTVIHYKLTGIGYPILFLHGMATGHRFWAPQEDHFSAKYQMIMPDLRGHGQSGKFIFSGFNLEIMADDMKHLLDHLEIKTIHAIGVSMGAMVALIFAIKYPNYVNRLVVSDGYCDFPNNAAKMAVKVIRGTLKRLPWKLTKKVVLSLYEKEKKGHSLTIRKLKQSYTVGKDEFAQMKMEALPHMTAELKKITVPTLVMGGDAISFEQLGSNIIYKHIRNASLAIFHDAFDPLNMMRKELFNEMVMDFLEGKQIKKYEGVFYTS